MSLSRIAVTVRRGWLPGIVRQQRFGSQTATHLAEYADIDLSHTPPLPEATQRYLDQAAVFVVSGANRGIGHALVVELLERSAGKVVCLVRDPSTEPLAQLAAKYGSDRVDCVKIDLSHPPSIDNAAAAVHAAGGGRVDMLLNVAGVLGDGSRDAGPERTARKLDAAWMQHTFNVNVFGHAALTGALYGNGCLRVGKKKKDGGGRPPAVVGSFTARVASIGDNRLGGWYSYRMSKAAMNMFTKTFSLEATRDRCFAVSLHPGTVDTDLSVPFQRGVPEGKLFDAKFSANQMLAVLDRIDETRSGGFFDWKGEAIPW
jgi:NAD(P)-dependent dehydrogenase (short-subunit alcohol dehydrogenase family)